MGLFEFLGKEEDYEDEKITGSTMNFRYLDNLIHSGKTKIFLECDIALDANEEDEYDDGIKIDVDDIVIEGNSHVIDAKGKARIFEILGDNVVVNSIAFKNAYSYSCGGAILVKHSSSCLIGDCGFDGNSVRINGAAIASYDSNLKVSNCRFNGNSADDGAAIYTGIQFGNFAGDNDGVVQGDKIRLDVEGCEFRENCVEGGDGFGGAICVRGSLATISDSKFHRNTAEQVGGAIENDSGIVTISNCIFDDNYSYAGGAISNYDYEASYSSMKITDSIFENNKADLDGGAIKNLGGNLTVSNTRFSNNSAKSGGAVLTPHDGDYEVKFDNCTYENNLPDDVKYSS